MERPVVFDNRKGQRLVGMLFAPDRPVGRRVGILLSVNAIKYRIGTYRLHTTLARHLCEAGYHVMYFDPAGIGDSEGEFEEKLLREHYLDIQRGKYQEDIEDAVGTFRSRCDLSSVVLLGLCGGAISMLIAAGRDRRVDGLILLAIPVLLERADSGGRDDDAADVITSDVQARRVLAEELAKIFHPRTWRKVVLLEADWRMEARLVGKGIAVFIRKAARAVLRRIRDRRDRGFEPPPSTNPRFNSLFESSFVEYARRGSPMLLVFADQDFVTWQFKSEFQDRVLVEGSPFRPLCEIRILENANHIFSARESQADLVGAIDRWLLQHHPVRETAR